MPIIQPLYFDGGVYTPEHDRNFIASFIGSTAEGTRISGVFGTPSISNSAMKVTAASGLNVTIAAGLCALGDIHSTDYDMYVAGIDTEALSVALTGPASGNRTDLLYAKFDDTTFKVSSASQSGTTVTLTTTSPHGFSIGDTITVSGLDDIFNGRFTTIAGTSDTTIVYTSSVSATVSSTTYTATAERIDSQSGGALGSKINITNRSFAPDSNSTTGSATITTESAHSIAVGDTVKISGLSPFFDGIYTAYTGTSSATNTIVYRKTGRAIGALGTSAAIQNFFAIVSAPFVIRQAVGTTTMPSVVGVPLAELDLTPTSISSITDRRIFVPANGCVQYYDSTAGGATNALRPDHADGKLTYDISENILYYSDGSGWNEISVSTHDHASEKIYQPSVLSATDTLAKPVSKCSLATQTISYTGSFYIPLSTPVSTTFTCTNRCYVMIQFSVSVNSASTGAEAFIDLDLSGATVAPAGTDAGTTSNSFFSTDGSSTGTEDMVLHREAALGSIGRYNSSRIYVLEPGTTTIEIYASNSTYANVTLNAANVRVIPLYATPS